MPIKIIKRVVDGAVAEAGRESWLWDSELKGFGLRLHPNGAKTYVLEYRPGPGGRATQKRRFTIGRHGSPWTPDTARAEARRLSAAVEAGADPMTEKSADRAAPTVSALAERFLTEHAFAKRKPATAAQYRRLFEKYILPEIGRMKMADVARRDIMRLHTSMSALPYQANRTLAVVSAFFTFSERIGARPDGANPARHVERFREEPRERMLSADELARLGDALDETKESPFVVALIKLLVFTGARLGEILTLEWNQVDFERREARLADSKTGRKTIHLSLAALEILTNLPRLADNPHVIPGDKPGGHFIGVQRPWQRIRAAAGLEGLRIHDLRHAFASVAASSGMALPIIGKLLGHTQAATTQRYAHLAADPVKAAAEDVAGRISEAMKQGARRGRTIIPFPGT
jgi:integrase